MSEPKVELRKVKEELALLEEQLEQLLDRQQTLLGKKELLEQEIKDAASSAGAVGRDAWDKEDFPWSKEMEEKRREVFGIDSFRPLQKQAINVTLSKEDCILIMPTGGGKSLCYQLPALISKGVTLVISPLVSLMEDQVMALENLSVNAKKLTASTPKQEVTQIMNSMANKSSDLKLLYVTPERLAKSKRFMAKLEKMYDCGRFARIAIDEIHCCSQWGHDFRPDYKFLGVLKRQFPGVPVLGLTATATNSVVQDVKKMLGLDGSCVIFRASFNRHNLYYEVYPKPSAENTAMLEIYKLISSRFKDESGIVYCLTQKDSEKVTQGLQSQGIKAGCYHANLDAKHRSSVHTRWLKNQIQVVVATIAFGMGIDKSNVRFVVHYSMSKSMENYYQESGRAGRDDKKAHCILYASFSDVFRQSTMVFTDQTGLEKLYAMVAYAFEQKRCRRTLIARHFGESWDSADCNGMCDNCDTGCDTEVVKSDITKHTKDLLAILKHAQQTQQRVTALKLQEAWFGRGAPTLRLSSVTVPRIMKEQSEKIIAHLLIEGILKEDFHFTPYSTISYLLPGPRAGLIENSSRKVEMDMKIMRKKTQTKTTTPNGTATPTTSKKKASSVKIKVINHAKSAFASLAGADQSETASTSHDLGDQKCFDKNGRTNETASEKRKTKKRAIVESDDEDLDFGEMSLPKRTKKKTCIVIDSDDESDAEAPCSVTSKENGSKTVANGEKKCAQLTVFDDYDDLESVMLDSADED